MSVKKASRRYLLGAAAAIVAVTAVATATAPSVAEEAASPPAIIDGRAPSLHPEGITWDPTREAFLVGSLRHGTVSIVEPDGGARTLAEETRIVSTVGVQVDAERDRVLAAYADYGVGTRSSPETEYQQAGLAIFDLETGETRDLIDLAIGPGPHIANDLTVDPQGNVYVTDSSSDKVYKVDTEGNASVFVRHEALSAPADESAGNGILWHPDGFLLVHNYHTGQLLKVPSATPDQLAPVQLPEPVVGGDGLAWGPDGSLVVVSNALGVTTEGAVTVLRPTIANGLPLR